MATSIRKIWNSKKTTVGAGSTINADPLPLTKFGHLDYILNFKDDSEANVKTIKLGVTKESSDVIDTVYSILGELDVTVKPKVSGSNYELEVTNNEAFALNLSLARAII